MTKEFKILDYEKLPRVDHGTGILTTMLISRQIGAENMTNGITNFPPGTKLALHYHNCDESVVILEGEGVAEVDGRRFPMKQFDAVYLPAGLPHRFLNQSDKPMKILWIYAASHVTRTFVETGVTVEHSSAEDEQMAARTA